MLRFWTKSPFEWAMIFLAWLGRELVAFKAALKEFDDLLKR